MAQSSGLGRGGWDQLREVARQPQERSPAAAAMLVQRPNDTRTCGRRDLRLWPNDTRVRGAGPARKTFRPAESMPCPASPAAHC